MSGEISAPPGVGFFRRWLIFFSVTGWLSNLCFLLCVDGRRSFGFKHITV